MASDGQQEWLELYRNALIELDHAKLPERIEAASSAIQQRIHELLLQKAVTQEQVVQEHIALEDAMRNLRSLRRQSEPG
jgi:hypothetical protein